MKLIKKIQNRAVEKDKDLAESVLQEEGFEIEGNTITFPAKVNDKDKVVSALYALYEDDSVYKSKTVLRETGGNYQWPLCWKASKKSNRFTKRGKKYAKLEDKLAERAARTPIKISDRMKLYYGGIIEINIMAGSDNGFAEDISNLKKYAEYEVGSPNKFEYLLRFPHLEENFQKYSILLDLYRFYHAPSFRDRDSKELAISQATSTMISRGLADADMIWSGGKPKYTNEVYDEFRKDLAEQGCRYIHQLKC